VSNHHTRKTFFAKALAGLAGLGLLGANRLAAKPAHDAQSASSAGNKSKPAFSIQTDSRSVARSGDTL
jgi:hypothetical protein